MPTNRVHARRSPKTGRTMPILDRILARVVVPWPGSAARDAVAAAQYLDHLIGAPERALIGETLARWREDEIDAAVAEHVAARPGSRPAIWWEHRSPCPRQRVGGAGDLWGDIYGRGGFPKYRLGLPDESWITQKTQSDYADTGLRVAGVAIDPQNAPTFESQATFLDRHRLLLPGERRRLKGADFAPERLAVA
jgi:hypothetical protein